MNKPVAASTFYQNEYSKLTSSVKLETKIRSFKAMLKNKLKPRLSSNKKTKLNKKQKSVCQTCLSFSQNIDKSETKIEMGNVVVAAICKLMNKSLGWLRNNQTQKQHMAKSKLAQGEETCEASYLSIIINDTQCSYESMNDDSFVQDDLLSRYSNCLVSTPKKAAGFYSPSFNNKNQLNNLGTISYINQLPLIFTNSPSMSSSLNQSKLNMQLHSTPTSEERKKEMCSPIFLPIEQNSLSSSIPTTSSSASLISGHHRFGLTSSPMSTHDSIEDKYTNSFSNMETYRQVYLENQIKPVEVSHVFDSLGLKEQLLLSHLNHIKNNVKVSVELGHLKPIKRQFVVENQLTMSNKKRRLQTIFQSKIQRQIKEIKNWRIGFKNKLELSNVMNSSVNTSSQSSCSNSSDSCNSINSHVKCCNNYQCYSCNQQRIYF